VETVTFMRVGETNLANEMGDVSFDACGADKP
jgi:hypothetical protein